MAKSSLEWSIADRAVSKHVKTEHFAKADAWVEAADILKEKMNDE